MPPTRPLMYAQLAEWWPLLSPPEDYADEADFIRDLLAVRGCAPGGTILELGCGGGHLASHLRQHYTLTLSDLSPAMLAQSHRLNPTCEHVEGDMRTLRLGREFDAVLVHDAANYLLTVEDLRAAVATAREQYEQECREREDEAAERNAHIDQLKNDLAFDLPEAIEEYVAIVLANSVYPESFQVTHRGTFDLATREINLTVSVPEPSTVPAVKEYRYIKTKDEIAESPLPGRIVKERYAGAVWQVAVRTLHEVFEADRAGRIQSIALTVGVERHSPATGLAETVPLVIAAANRAQFEQFDLDNVVPAATLDHLGAAKSKSPYDLTPAVVGGVRRGATS